MSAGGWIRTRLEERQWGGLYLNQVEGYHDAPREVHTAFVGEQIVESADGIKTRARLEGGVVFK